jgi:hypothetical protein
MEDKNWFYRIDNKTHCGKILLIFMGFFYPLLSPILETVTFLKYCALLILGQTGH